MIALRRLPPLPLLLPFTGLAALSAGLLAIRWALQAQAQEVPVNLKALVARRVPSGVVSLPDRFLEAAPRQLDPRAPDGTAVRVSKA
jgi:hypothetical protein